MENLDPLLHQPLRTQLVAYLAGASEATFSDLKRTLDVSDGNLDAHLKKLVAAGYVDVRKEKGEGRPQSRLLPTAACCGAAVGLRGGIASVEVHGRRYGAYEADIAWQRVAGKIIPHAWLVCRGDIVLRDV